MKEAGQLRGLYALFYFDGAKPIYLASKLSNSATSPCKSLLAAWIFRAPISTTSRARCFTTGKPASLLTPWLTQWPGV